MDDTVEVGLEFGSHSSKREHGVQDRSIGSISIFIHERSS